MVSALDRIGSLSGGTHHKKCWHHFGISERIAFLEAGQKEPKLFKNHHAKVYLSLAIYCLVLGILWTI
ncbi:MAG: peptidase M48, partial [Chlamydiia bacterium]|nr:peptidase M48 [Chlamydiia bacterium]